MPSRAKKGKVVSAKVALGMVCAGLHRLNNSGSYVGSLWIRRRISIEATVDGRSTTLLELGSLLWIGVIDSTLSSESESGRCLLLTVTIPWLRMARATKN